MNSEREAELVRLAEQTRVVLLDLTGGPKFRLGYVTALVHHLCDVIEQAHDPERASARALRAPPVRHDVSEKGKRSPKPTRLASEVY